MYAILVALVLVFAPGASAQSPSAKETVYDFSLVDQSGKLVPLSEYKGKVLLIVNLASQSVYSSQISALNDLEKTYGSQGLAVLGIPSPDFGGEELKDPAALRTYYMQTAHADFPVFASATITGVQAIPLFQYLCDPKQSVQGGDLRWSYTKFLIGRDGKPLARYEVDVDPADVDFRVAIEKALSGKSKQSTPSEKPAADRDLAFSIPERNAIRVRKVRSLRIHRSHPFLLHKSAPSSQRGDIARSIHAGRLA